MTYLYKCKFVGKITAILIGVFAVGALGACSFSQNPNVEYKYPKKVMGKYTTKEKTFEERDTIFGKGGMDLFGNKKQEYSGGGIGVNSFLWRASLDTVAFMPLSSADPFGGVIITDWYSPSVTPNERFKLSVFILSKELRADGIKVSAFRQVRSANKDWVDAKTTAKTALDLENAILTRARELKISYISSGK